MNSAEVTIKDKTFRIIIPAEKIRKRVEELAAEINREYAGRKPVIVGVLNGAVLFTVGLFEKLEMECELSFIRVASYQGINSSGTVTGIIGLKENLENRHVLIVEDIVDTGETARHIFAELEKMKPASMKLATALFKPAALKTPVKPDYVGFEVAPDFLVGYGLDYDGLGRNLKDIYVLKT